MKFGDLKVIFEVVATILWALQIKIRTLYLKRNYLIIFLLTYNMANSKTITLHSIETSYRFYEKLLLLRNLHIIWTEKACLLPQIF